MWVDPPAVSRIHQTMSDAMLGFQNAAALEDVPVPFPYAQVVSFCLVLFAVSGNGSLGRQRIPGTAADPWGGSGSLGRERIGSLGWERIPGVGADQIGSHPLHTHLGSRDATAGA